MLLLSMNINGVLEETLCNLVGTLESKLHEKYCFSVFMISDGY